MAKLKIFTFPDLVLTQKAKPLARVERSIYSFVDDMLETMYDAPGIGLAANQVGSLQRVLVIDTEYDLEEVAVDLPAEAGKQVQTLDKVIIKNKKPRVIINPEIASKEGSITLKEGCLSVPEYSAEVKRAERVVLKYQDIDGLTQTLSAEGLLAVAIQHEIDHLDGKLFIDRLSPLKKEWMRKRLRIERKEREQNELSNASLRSRKKKKEF